MELRWAFISGLVGIIARSIDTTKATSFQNDVCFRRQKGRSKNLFRISTLSTSTSRLPPTPTGADIVALTDASPAASSFFEPQRIEVSDAAIWWSPRRIIDFQNWLSGKSMIFHWLRLRPFDGIDTPMARVPKEDPGYRRAHNSLEDTGPIELRKMWFST